MKNEKARELLEGLKLYINGKNGIDTDVSLKLDQAIALFKQPPKRILSHSDFPKSALYHQEPVEQPPCKTSAGKFIEKVKSIVVDSSGWENVSKAVIVAWLHEACDLLTNRDKTISERDEEIKCVKKQLKEGHH